MINNIEKSSNVKLVFVGIFVIVLIILFITSAFIKYRESELTGSDKGDPQIQITTTIKFASSFPECNLLYDDCLDMTCGLYFLCNEQNYSTCEIYDCGEEFGIGTEDRNGETRITKELKVDKDKVEEIVSKCRGASLSVIDKECVENKLKININIESGDKCIIKNFMVEYNSENEKKYSSVEKFSDLGNNNYLIIINSCDDSAEFIAIGEGGIGIK